jgi:hypothetical protein
MNLALDLVSQLLKGVIAEKRSNVMPDSQHLRLTQMAQKQPLEAGQKHAQAVFLWNSKQRVGFVDATMILVII